MLLTGSFREYPFFLLLEIFLRRGETGVLEVSSPEESGYFYIKNGKVKEGQIGTSRGAAAVKLVGRCVDGSFRFKPLEPTDYARVVWQRSFGPNALATDPTSIPVAAVRSKFGHLRSYPAAAYRLPEQAPASLVHGMLRQSLLFPQAVYQSFTKIALFVQQRLVAWTIVGIAFCKRAHPRNKLRSNVARTRNMFSTLDSYRAAAYQSAAQGVASSNQRVFRKLRLNMGTAYLSLSQTTADLLQGVASSSQRVFRQLRLDMGTAYLSLSQTTANLLQHTVAWTTAAFAFWKELEVGTRLLRVTKNGFRAWQRALRRDKRRILNYASGFTFEVSLPTIPKRAAIPIVPKRAAIPTIPKRAAIFASLKQGIANNITFALVVCLLGSVSVFCIYQLLTAGQDAMDSGTTIDENFETQISPTNSAPTSVKPKPRRSKRRSTGKKLSVSSLQEPSAFSRTKGQLLTTIPAQAGQLTENPRDYI